MLYDLKKYQKNCKIVYTLFVKDFEMYSLHNVRVYSIKDKNSCIDLLGIQIFCKRTYIQIGTNVIKCFDVKYIELYL